MGSRDIHSRDGGTKVRDFLGSLLTNLILSKNLEKPIYLISPWLSDFCLLENQFGQFRDLFIRRIEFSENPKIFFSQVLLELSSKVELRIMSSQVSSKKFLDLFSDEKGVQTKFKLDTNGTEHQKGFLSEKFYFEGSMNFTYSGVYKNKEKITCNSVDYPDGKQKIVNAYLELERTWDHFLNENGEN
jgi:hypothetical protein